MEITVALDPLPEIHLASLAYTFGHWLQREGTEDWIDLNAPYQRGSVWTLDQRQALVKSLYMGVPVGAVIISKLPFRVGNPIHTRVVDGKQRIETCRMWANDEFSVPSWWFAPEYVATTGEDLTWSGLSEAGRCKFVMSTSLPALEFNAETVFIRRTEKGWITHQRTDDEIFVAEAELYALVNGGGTPQTNEDMARARAVASA